MLPALYTLSKLVLNSALWVNAEEHLASCCTTVATYSCTFWPSLRLQWFNRVAMPFLLMLYTMYVHCMYTPYVRCIIWSFQFSHSFVFHCFILFVTFFALFFFYSLFALALFVRNRRTARQNRRRQCSEAIRYIICNGSRHFFSIHSFIAC